jgi:hypothetical protein
MNAFLNVGLRFGDLVLDRAIVDVNGGSGLGIFADAGSEDFVTDELLVGGDGGDEVSIVAVPAQGDAVSDVEASIFAGLL